MAPMDLNISIPAIAAIPRVFMMEPMPPLPDFDLNIMLDTIPIPPSPQFDMHGTDYEQFGKEFESRFKEQFGDFYEKHENEIGAMIKELEARFDSHSMEEWNNMHLEKLDSQLSQLEREEMWSQHEEHMRDFEQQMEHWAEENARNFEQLDRQLKAVEDSRREFEKEIRNELNNDGYLKEGVKISSIEINNEIIKINGKPLKDSDQKKYRDLLKKDSFYHEGPKHPGGRRE